ncbi:hypothetical protein CERSUDRAFT_78597 [Gelatoporia subvermispora B]|uniref:HECT domain-containing protein n=1 Tax=Ceriporiopsis subvermispora (strain B) TaxID=914234 RepID=M2QFM5_CERS8|nr:hypothetical protein CERSUDRAFT_78597 [Gelatoporia subvermispora B]
MSAPQSLPYSHPALPSASGQHISSLAAPIQPYLSTRLPPVAPNVSPTQPLVATTAVPGPQPFSGLSNGPFPGLASLVPTAGAGNHVNQARLASSSRSSSRGSSRGQLVASRGRGQARRRGQAVQPPALHSLYPARVPNPSGTGPDLLRIQVLVYPPQSGFELQCYAHLRDTFARSLQQIHLLYELEVPIDTTIVQLAAIVTERMRASPYQYMLTSPAQGLEHERLTLNLLSFRNRGIRRANDGPIILNQWALSASTNLESLLGSRNRFYPQGCCPVADRFTIRFAIARNPVYATIRPSTSTSQHVAHSCIADKLYSEYPTDFSARNSELQSDDLPLCLGCEYEASLEESRTRSPSPIHPAPMQVSPSSSLATLGQPDTLLEPSLGSARTIEDITQEPPAFMSVLQRTSTVLPSQASFVPAAIWEQPWTPAPIMTSSILPCSDIHLFAENCYNAASSGAHVLPLAITGESLADLVTSFKLQVKAACDRQDFTALLSPRRSFMIQPAPSENNPSPTPSFGEGVEREVLFTAFSEYRSSSLFVAPRLDDTYSILNIPIASLAMSENRRDSMSMFGALTALVMLEGLAPTPLDPVYIHYLIYDCDFSSITREIVQEWHPSFYFTLCDWLDTGHGGNISRFGAIVAEYTDLDISSLQTRDTEVHRALAALLLYRALLGRDSPSHPDTRSFLKGFQLPCRNGFSFIKAIRAFEGGSDRLLNLLWTSHITSYDSIADIVEVRGAASLRTSHPSVTISGTQHSIESLIIRFLQGSGVPCQAMWGEICSALPPHIDLAQIDAPAFRSRMFHLAITGADSVPCSGPDRFIQIYLVGDNDPIYQCEPESREHCIKNGNILIRTCFRKAIIFMSFITSLAEAEYSPLVSDTPGTFFEAFDSWLLRELLLSIGNYGLM